MMNMQTWYKDILWIDDMDSNDSTTADLMAEKGKTLEEINKNPEKEKKFISADENLQKYIDMIQLSTTMKDAVDEIENNYNNYNLVIFDMNMNRGWGNKEQDVEYINGIFKSQNIKSFDNNDKIAGIYLYLFLLKKGYPANRMIIYTGNAKSTGEILNDNLYLDFKGLIKDNGIQKGFIILRVNNRQITSVSDIEEIYKEASNSTDPVLFISGVYPSGRRAYYSIDLSDE